MAIWISIAAGLGVGFLMLRMKNILAAWLGLFNLMVSIYLGIMLSPTLFAAIPGFDRSRYNLAALLFLITVLVFAALHSFCVYFLTGRMESSFPKVISSLGCAVLGFLTGLLGISFLFFVVFTLPNMQEGSIARLMGKSDPKAVPPSAAVIQKSSVFVSDLSQQYYDNATPAVYYMMDVEYDRPDDPNDTETAKPAEKAKTKPSGPDPNKPAPAKPKPQPTQQVEKEKPKQDESLFEDIDELVE